MNVKAYVLQELQVLRNVKKFCRSDYYRVLRKVFYIPRHKKRTFFGEGYFIKDNVLWVWKYIASSILFSWINAKPFICRTLKVWVAALTYQMHPFGKSSLLIAPTGGL